MKIPINEVLLYYDSAVHFEFEGIKVNPIIVSFSVKNKKKNIIPVIEGSAVVHGNS